MPRDLAHERDIEVDDLARLMTRLRLEEARTLSRPPHVRRVIRKAEALVEPHPLGRFPDLQAKIDRDMEYREHASVINLPNIVGAVVITVLFWALVYYGGVAVLEAMERAAAEAAIRGPY